MHWLSRWHQNSVTTQNTLANFGRKNDNILPEERRHECPSSQRRLLPSKVRSILNLVEVRASILQEKRRGELFDLRKVLFLVAVDIFRPFLIFSLHTEFLASIHYFSLLSGRTIKLELSIKIIQNFKIFWYRIHNPRKICNINNILVLE